MTRWPFNATPHTARPSWRRHQRPHLTYRRFLTHSEPVSGSRDAESLQWHSAVWRPWRAAWERRQDNASKLFHKPVTTFVWKRKCVNSTLAYVVKNCAHCLLTPLGIAPVRRQPKVLRACIANNKSLRFRDTYERNYNDYPTFSRSSNSRVLFWILPRVGGGMKFKMAAAKPVIYIYI